jgi:spoIIIJ-associated protein
VREPRETHADEEPQRKPTEMSDPKRRFFSGDTLQQALVQAANHFQLDPEQIAYRSIEKKHGFIKVRRKVVIEVDPEAPKQTAPSPPPPRPVAPPVPAAFGAAPAAATPGAPGAPPRAAAPAPRPRRERGGRERDSGRRRDSRERSNDYKRAEGGGVWRAEPPRRESLVSLPERPRQASERFPLATGPAAEAAAKGMELLLRISGLDLEARVLQGEERLEVDLSGEDVDWCFADDGEFLMAVEHLLPRIIRSLSGEAIPCRVDCDNFHEIREERLRSLAQRVADEVRRLHRPRTLEPMNPGDRRIVHVTLADDPGVVTESEGDGYLKRITIRPV